MHRHVVGLAAVAAVLGLGACGAISNALTARQLDAWTNIHAGDCYDGGTSSDGFMFGAKVPCYAPHMFEIVAVVAAPDDLVAAGYGAMVSSDGTLSAEATDGGMELCGPAIEGASGLTERLSGVVPFDKLVLWPGVSGNPLVAAPPEAVWDASPFLLCALQLVGGDGQPQAHQWDSGLPALTYFGGQATPEELRVCDLYDAASASFLPVPCSRPHSSELLFAYDARELKGNGWPTDLDPAVMTDKDWYALQSVCTAGWSQVFGTRRKATDVAIVVDLSPAEGNSVFGEDVRAVLCLAAPADPGMLLDGPVWGLGDEPATLVPVSLVPSP